MKKKVRLYSSAVGYDLAAAGYDKKSAYLNSFEQGKVLTLLGEVKDKIMLDVGAGTGRLSVPLANFGAKVTALDVSPAMLKILQQKNRHVMTIVGEAESLPFPNDSFDVVVAAFLIVHLKNPQRFFDEVYRVLKNGGIFLVTNINQKDPPSISTKAGPIIIESFYHRPEHLRELLGELAFTIVREEKVKEKDVWITQIIVAQK